jgi:DNA-binding transcriptional MerR regulator
MKPLQVFELPDLIKILGLSPTKAKNWTNGRSGVMIEPSIRKATGTGSRNLYSVEDLYLMGIALEFNKAGFTAKAIGKLLEAARPMLADVAHHAVWTVYRKAGGQFRVEQGSAKAPPFVLRHMLDIGALIKTIDAAVERLHWRV